MSSEASDAVMIEVRGRTLVVTLKRPRAGRAVDQATADGVTSALDRLAADDELSAAVLTGAGSRFPSSMDPQASSPSWVPAGRGIAGIVERSQSKPIIAAVEGAAAANGLEVALACDIIVAARDAEFGLSLVRQERVSTGRGLRRPTRRVPSARALNLGHTGEPITAEWAYQLGLIDHVVDPGTALTRALAVAEGITENGPLDVAERHALVWNEQSVDSGLRALLAEHDRCWRQLDAAGVSSLWNPWSTTVMYFGDECRDPVVGQSDLRQHCSRMVRRLTRAEMHSELVVSQKLGPGAATLMARMKWAFTLAGQPSTSGASWVGATAVRTASGWRFVQYVERLTENG